jgi:hypothetical protein
MSRALSTADLYLRSLDDETKEAVKKSEELG